MKKLTSTMIMGLFLVCLTVLVTSGCGNANAKIRVDAVLKGMTEKGKHDTQGKESVAVCQFYAGVNSLDFSTMDIASNKFDRWKIEGDVYPRIKHYTVEEAEGDGDAVIVSGTINGAPFKVRVPEKGPIAWVEIPQWKKKEAKKEKSKEPAKEPQETKETTE